MKVNTAINQIERSGHFENQQFAIKTSAQAFQILSSGLYSNKIRAIIRELSCNAYDSHVAAGKEGTGFRIHLPSHLEPFFAVRDYGTGLSHEDVMNLYTTYFGSNKTGSNDLTGCFGLGSKSPFSYTDTFTVNSYFNGTKSSYAAVIAEEGYPTINKLCEASSEEENGLEVSFPVDINDIYKFEIEASEVLSAFPKCPSVNAPQFVRTIDKVAPSYSGEDWAVYKHQSAFSHDYSYGSSYKRPYSVFAVMGNVAYNVDLTHLKANISEVAVKFTNIVLYCPIGSFEVTPSREDISYTEKSITYLSKTIEAFNNKLVNAIIENVKNKPTWFEAKKETACLGRILNTVAFQDNPIYYNGEDIKEPFTIKHNITFKSIIPTPTYYRAANKDFSISQSKMGASITLERLFTTETVIFCRKNKEKFSFNQFTKHLRKHGHVKYSKEDAFKILSAQAHFKIITATGKESEIKAFLADIGLTEKDVIFLSDLDIDTSLSVPKSQKNKDLNFFRFNTNGTNIKTFWNRASTAVDVNSDELFVFINSNGYITFDKDRDVFWINKRPAHEKHTLHPREFRSFVESLPKNTHVYGIKKSQKDQLGEGWCYFWDVYHDYLAFNIRNEAKLVEQYRFSCYAEYDIVRVLNLLSHLNVSWHPSVKYVLDILDETKYSSFFDYKTLYAVRSIMHYFPISTPTLHQLVNSPVGKAREWLSEALMEYYPLLAPKMRPAIENKCVYEDYVRMVNDYYNY